MAGEDDFDQCHEVPSEKAWVAGGDFRADYSRPQYILDGSGHGGLVGTNQFLTVSTLEDSRIASNEPALPVSGHMRLPAGQKLADVEREVILATLETHGGHRVRTAEALGIGVRTLGMKLKRWREEAQQKPPERRAG